MENQGDDAASPCVSFEFQLYPEYTARGGTETMAVCCEQGSWNNGEQGQHLLRNVCEYDLI